MIKRMLVSALAITAAPYGISAENDDAMVVTASGYEQKLRQAAASISVISQRELSQHRISCVA